MGELHLDIYTEARQLISHQMFPFVCDRFRHHDVIVKFEFPKLFESHV